MIEFQDAKRVAGMLAAIGEPTRMLILYRLAHGPHHVGMLSEMLGVPMVNMSHHLGVLRQAGLLDDEKDGRRVVYKFRPEICSPSEGDPSVLATLTLAGLYRFVIRRGDDTAKFKLKKKPLPRKVASPTESEAVPQ